MKKLKSRILLIILLFLAVNASPLKSSAQVSVNFQVFYDNLAPYGHWVTYPGYGYVWSPAVVVGFRPYVSSGHWVYSDQGWVWVSNYDWGWATFHYGSWIEDPAYGWLWVPGYDWAPAWVTWGTYNGYYGWAPVGPGFSISVGYYPPINHWCFMEPRYMTYSDWGNHYYVAHNNRIVINNTIIINNERRISSVSNTASYVGHSYYAGPRREEYQRVARTTVTPVALRESNNPGRTQVTGSAVNIYRPRINAGTKVYSKPSNAIAPDRLKSARTTPDNPAKRTGENRPSGGNNVRPAQQPEPANQHPQRQSIDKNRTSEPARNNSMPAPAQREQKQSPQGGQQRNTAPVQRQQQQNAAPAERQQRTRESVPMQHHQVPAERQQLNKMPSQQRAQPAPNIQHQPAGRQETAPQQRQQAPRQEQRKESGRPKTNR